DLQPVRPEHGPGPPGRGPPGHGQRLPAPSGLDRSGRLLDRSARHPPGGEGADLQRDGAFDPEQRLTEAAMRAELSRRDLVRLLGISAAALWLPRMSVAWPKPAPLGAAPTAPDEAFWASVREQ